MAARGGLSSSSLRGNSVFEEYRELAEDVAPVADGSLPLLLHLGQGQVEELIDGLVGREVAPVLEQLAKGAVQGLDGVSGVDDLPDVRWEVEEGNDPLPVAPPGGGDHRVATGPLLLEGVQGHLGLLPRGRRVDGPQVLGHGLAVLVAHEAQGVADHVDDAGLDYGLREDRLDGFREAFEAIAAGD